MRILTVISTCLVLSPFAATAQEVYNFRFVPKAVAPKPAKKKAKRALPKAPPAQAASVAAPAPVVVAAPAAVAAPLVGATPAPIETQSIAKLPEPAKSESSPRVWQVSIGAAKVINYAEEVQGFAFGIERALGANFSAGASAVTGHPALHWDSSVNPDALAWTFSIGGAWTPLHFHPGLIKSLDLSALAGVLNTRGHTDETVSATQIAPYIGAGIALELTSRVGLMAQIKFERADVEFGEGLGAVNFSF